MYFVVPLLLLLCHLNANRRHPMDPLSITAGIIGILDLANKVIHYLDDVKNASEDRVRCALEVSSMNTLFLTLKYRLEKESSKESWYMAVQALAVPKGPLDQYRHALEQLLEKLAPASGIQKVGKALLWHFCKEQVTNLLLRIERIKTLVQIALEIDHLLVSGLNLMIRVQVFT
jgi:hypothetical protein